MSDPGPSTGPLRPSAPSDLHWSGWYLTLPKLAIAMLVVMLAALFWLLNKNEAEDQRAGLVADVLWLEQNLRFHLEGNADQIQQLAIDLNKDADAARLFDTRARHMLKNNPELTHLFWLNADSRLTQALPSEIVQREPPDPHGQSPTAEALELAKQLGKPVYSDVYASGNDVRFELYVPFYEGQKLGGVLVGIYSLNSLLGQVVPWWFTEKYQVQIVDDDGRVLAAKSRVDAGNPSSLNYQIPLEPPGHGLLLRAIAHQQSGNLAQRFIAIGIVLLAGAVFWSLWAIRSLIRRRLAAEQALRSEHAFRKAMEDSLTVGMRARDREGRITYVNPAFCEMTGFSAGELIGTLPPYPYWEPETIEATQKLHDAVLDGRAPVGGFELRFQRKNGECFDALVYEAPLIDVDGRHTGWMGSVLDVTERKRTEELARQQQEKLQATSRLVTMGEMASTLAHELNQPLAAISSYNTGCLNKLDSGNFTPAELRGALEKLGTQAQRAGKIIRRVHDFVRKSEPKLAECDLAEVIDDAIGFIEHFAQKRYVRIERELPGWRHPLLADQVMIEQVLLNLMRNAIEAMGETPLEKRHLAIRASEHDGVIEVRVADNGSGIADAVKERLFTPFFSTKPDGMGMGLNICRSIIEFHKGRFWVEDNPTGGTIFAFTLPLKRPDTP